MNPIIGGLDVSFSGTAIALGDGQRHNVHRVKCPNLGHDVKSRVKRIETIVSQVMRIIEATPPRAMFIEAYSYGSTHGGEMLGELGGVIRWHLDEIPIIREVAPGTNKKFVTGSGNAKKEQMIAHVLKNWGELFETNDDADAFGLYRLGLCCCGLAEPANQKQREAVKTVVGSDEPLSLYTPVV